MKNSIEFLWTVVTTLKKAGIDTIVFGGWAEELTGLNDPRPHGDVDLLYPAPDFSRVDAFLRNADVQEIILKHFFHKRAFMYHGVMVELILVQPNAGVCSTVFWDQYKLVWPELTDMSVEIEGDRVLRVATPEILRFYRDIYNEIDVIRRLQ